MPGGRKSGFDKQAMERREREEDTRFTLRILQDELELSELVVKQLGRRYPNSELVENLKERIQKIKQDVGSIEKQS